MKIKLLIYFLGMLIILSISISSCRFGTGKKLRVGTNVEYPPFAFRHEAEFKGIDIDLAKAVGEKAGFEVEIINLKFEQLIPALQEGEIDMIASAMTITPEREEILQFTSPYFMAGQAFLIRADNPVRIDSLPDLANYRVGSLNQTTGMELVEHQLILTKLMHPRNLIPFRTNSEALSALLNDRIDFVVMDNAPAYHYAQTQPLKVAFEYKTNELYGFAFSKGSPDFNRVNEALRELIISGKVKTIMAKYGIDQAR